MNADFYRPAYLAHLFDWMGEISGGTNCLFVTLDSNPNVLEAEKHLSPLLRRAQVDFWWKPEGLWVAGTEFARPIVADQISVPFSAC